MDVRSDNKTIPLAVDLDGTLIATDLLWEGLFLLLRKNPLYLFLVPFWAFSGPARLKQEIAARIDVDVASLPYREELVERLREERRAGRRIVLATGTPRKFAEAIAAHLGIFDAVHATDGSHNLTSGRKCKALVEAYGDGGFDYAGNSRHDLHCFDVARAAIVVAPDRQAARWQSAHGAELFDTPKPTARTYLKMVRAHQWAKNVLIGVPMVLSHELDFGMIAACVLAFISFSAAASAVYILNDFFDLALDRRHKTKRKRPFASGLLSIPFGLKVSAGLLALSFACAAMLPPLFAAALAGYLVTTTAYSLSVKRMLLIDVLTLAGLYTIRILAGAAATGTTVSFWLLAFAIFFFLSLALVKRYVELRQTPDLVIGQRVAGRGYRVEDQEIIAQAGMASAFSSAMVLALYIDSDAVKELYVNPWMMWPLAPIILYLTMRVWILARRDEMHDDPVVFITTDWRSQLFILAGAVLLAAAALS